MHELSKSIHRRLHSPGYATRYFVGRGIDVGCGNDCLSQYAPLFPLVTSVDPWDTPQGDAQTLEGVPDNHYDFLVSSHCLEHLRSPTEALRNWVRVVRPGGHLVVVVPDEDAYEQGVWPSTFNGDHKRTFTILKNRSWSPASVNVADLLRVFADEVTVIKIELLTHGNVPTVARVDQTLNAVAESAIEFVVRKR